MVSVHEIEGNGSPAVVADLVLALKRPPDLVSAEHPARIEDYLSVNRGGRIPCSTA
jgi:hypothetical protein